MILDFLKSIKKKQWSGLFFGLIVAVLGWLELVFIISPATDKDDHGKPLLERLDTYDYYALGISIVTAVLVWLKLLVTVG